MNDTIEAGAEINAWDTDPARQGDPPFYVNGMLIGVSDDAVEGEYVVLSECDTLEDGMGATTAIRCIPIDWISEIKEVG